MATNTINTIIFDLGGVLLDWNPKYVYDENYFDSPEKHDYFFNNICTNDWNEVQDAGRSIVDATQMLVKQFPDWEQPIRDFYGRWTEMLRGPIPGTVEIFRQIKDSGKYKTYALTNWQADLFHVPLVRYNFLHWFDGRVVSGEENEFYQRLLDRYNVTPQKALFVDDNLRNVKAAEELGIVSIHFQSPAQFKDELQQLGIL